MRGEEGPHLAEQIGVSGGRLGERALAFAGGLLEDGVKQGVDLLPPLWRHSPASPSGSRVSQAFATVQ